MRVAFGTQFGMSGPEKCMGDRDYVRTRWLPDPNAAFVALLGGEPVGSNCAARWGSVGFFGPLTVRPDLWDRGIGKALMEPVVRLFEASGTRHAGLFTFAESEEHVGLYQRFDCWPRFLTAFMAKPVGRIDGGIPVSTFGELLKNDRANTIGAFREITETLYEGLDLRSEIEAVAAPISRPRATIG